MRRIIVGMIVLLLSVWLGITLTDDPGIAMFVYHGWSAEMPLWFAALCFILLVFFSYAVIRFMDGIDNFFYRWKSWLRWRRKYRSYSKTNRGLLELIEGHWRSAENYLLDGIEQSDAPLINYLAAAKAAHQRGAYDKRDAYLRAAHELSPQESVAIGLMQAEFQMEQGQLEQALATLHHLRLTVPEQTKALALLERVYVHLADWKGLVALLPDMRKTKLMTTERLNQLEQNAYVALMQSHVSKAVTKSDWEKVWAMIPRRMQKNPKLVFCYVKQLLTYPDSALEAEELINKTIRKSWDKELVKLYGFIQTANPQKQLAHAEAWLKQYPSQSALFLTLGRLSVRCELWGKARSYFDDALRLEACPEVYVEYGKFYEQMGDVSAAAKSYRKGLVVANECGVV